MPTAVSVARECLTDEAARALDDAVAVARRRGHAQTTSLHAVSALLALPASLLRDACARARSSAYAPRLQFRALELSVGVSLDRMSSSNAVEEPPVSNSLMAAIKRSQANQRRHPESFHLHQLQIQQQQQSATSLSIVKVELKHFVLSILDDPTVSKVFGEAGFRSYDIKIAILSPPAPPLPPFSRARCPPLFLGNLPWGDSNLAAGGLRFPFPGSSSAPAPAPATAAAADGDENCRRIVDVLVKKKERNPLLIGVCAGDALSGFVDFVQQAKDGALPAQISGLKIVCIKKEVSEFVLDAGNEEQLGLKFEELASLLAAEHCSGPGVVVSFGELARLVGDGASTDALSQVISRLTDLVKLHGDRLRLIGAAESYETYSKFLSRFSNLVKEWDLQLLPITSSKPSSIEGLYPKSSLMGSFVPFGGFFSTPSDFKNPLSNAMQSESRCSLCNEKYEREVSAILKGGSGTSVSDQCSASLPSWLQVAEPDTGKGIEAAQARDGPAMNAKIMALQKKWNETCQRLHNAKTLPVLSHSRVGLQVAGAEDLRLAAVRKHNLTSSLNENYSTTSSQSAPVGLIGQLLSKQKMPIQVVSEAETIHFQSRLQVRAPVTQQSETRTHWLPPKTQTNLNLLPDHTSSSPVISVTTDLQLGMQYTLTSGERKSNVEVHKSRLRHFSGTVSSSVDVEENNSKQNPLMSTHSGPDMGGSVDPNDFKALWRSLSEKVGWQDEAIIAISQTVSLYRTGNKRKISSNYQGAIWFSFLGPDYLGKKKIATALAEVVFGSRENLISVDLSNQQGFSQSNSIFHCQESNNYDVNFRGKTIVDHISGEMREKPHSVVFLDSIDKADPLAQSSLFQAVKTGKFPDSHGRVFSINNMIFVTASSATKGGKSSLTEKKPVEFSEERILRAKSWEMQMLVKSIAASARRISKGLTVFVATSEGQPNGELQRKRKQPETNDRDPILEVSKQADRKSFLDLNLPVEEVQDEDDTEISDNVGASDNSDPWLTDFYNEVDQTIVLRPFDFDALADKVLKEINLHFQKMMGCDVLLEIDPEVMVEILAAAWLSDKKSAVEDWIKQVLSHSFAEARQRYAPTAQYILKLVAREGIPVKERAVGIQLPAKITLN